jgi:hypothetical protein
MSFECFTPVAALATELLPHALELSDDGAHDLAHLQPVWHNVRTLHEEEGGDLEPPYCCTIAWPFDHLLRRALILTSPSSDLTCTHAVVNRGR